MIGIETLAAKRGKQTLAQGLAVDIAVALALVVLTIIPGIESWADVSELWPVWLLMLSKSAVSAAVAWVVRRYGDPAGAIPEHGPETP